MYKVITIKGNDYRFEYTIEASLYKDFVKVLTDYVMNFSSLVAKYNIKGEKLKTEDDALNISTKALSEMMTEQTTTLPKLAILGFYAGLLENHNITYEEAKQLYIDYLKEYHKTPIEVVGEIMEKVQEDNFFAMIGLDLTKMETLNKSNTKKPNQTTKKR